MPLVTNTVPNMIGGVAQTPPSIRQPNQCEVQENAVSSIVDGLSKRPPTQNVSELTEYGSTTSIPSTDGVALHTINRDTNERYLVSLDNADGTGTIRVHDVDGNPVQVLQGTNAYLNIADGADPSDEFDFLTIADVTYIVNKNKTIEFTGDTAPYSRQGEDDNGDPWPAGGGSAEALLWVNKSDYSTSYKVHLGGTLVALYKTPDGVNSDVSIGSVPLKFIDAGGGSSSLHEKYITLRALAPEGNYVHTRTYQFLNNAASTVAHTFTDTDLTYKGALDIAKIKSGDIAEPGTGAAGSQSPNTYPDEDDMYEIVADMSEDSALVWDLNTTTGDGFTTWDTNDSTAVAMNITAGDMIYWTGARWDHVSAANQMIKVGVSDLGTAAAVAAVLKTAMDSTNGHNGMLSSRITNEDDIAAETDPTKSNNILTISQTKSGQLGNTLITTDVGTADMVDLDTSAAPTQFTGGSFSDGVGDEPEDLEAGTIKVAEELSSQLNDVSGYTTMQSGSVIYIHKTDDTDLDITVEEDGGGENLRLIKRDVQVFTDLPPIAPKGFIVEISGAIEKDIDNYFVKFKVDGTEDEDAVPPNYLGTGKYIETTKPGIKYKLNTATMPHILIRQSTGTFYFKAADGTTPGDTGVSAPDYSNYGWHDRLVGDTTTNLDPSFIDYKINAISLFKGRLVLLSDENIIFSETSIFWNFFRLKTTVLLNSDRIDVSPSSERVSVLRSMVGYNDRLVVSSDQTQFAVKGNPLVTPTSISITPASDFENIKNCEPIRSGTSLFYAFKRGSFSGVRELFATNNNVSLTFNNNDLTEAIPSYIPGSIRQIAGSTHESVICVLSDDSSNLNKLFVYNYDQRGDRRVLTSWSTFTFSCTKIESVSFIDSTLYLVVRRTGGLYLEKMDLSSGLSDTSTDYVTTIDRRVKFLSTDDVNVIYSTVTGNTTVTLPYAVEAGTTMQVVSAYGPTDNDPAGYVYTLVTTPTGGETSLVVSGDLTDKNFFVGELYTMTYEFTKITMKVYDRNTQTVDQLMGRHQLRYGEIAFTDTGFFRINVTPTNKDASIYKYTGKILGSGTARLGGDDPLSSGTFRFPVFSKSQEVKIEIINDSPFPGKFVSASFDALFMPRVAARARY